MKALKDRVAIVTGGSAGIGYATVKRFLEEGASVVFGARSQERISAALEELGALGTVRGYTLDISKKDQVQSFNAKVLEEFGRVDILVNNASITADAQFYKMTDEQFEQVLDVNLKGTYYMSKSAVPSMMERNYGKIIHLSSVSAFNGNFGQANYAATKAAIMGMTRVMAKELGKYGINVNAVAPGSILTEMYNVVPEETKQKKMAGIPLRRFGEPSEVAALLAFLASDEASYITAQTIVIDGGFN